MNSNRLRVFALSLAALSVVCQAALPGLRTNGRYLEAPTGERIVLKGVNHETVWLNKTGDPDFAEIAKTKANAVRIVWTIANGTPAGLDLAITNCIKQGMIPIVELHDATGDWSKLSTVVDAWVGTYLTTLKKHEKYVIVNVGNEIGQTVTDANYQAGYNTAVQRMRRAGIRCPILIDASGYGQSYTSISNSANAIIAADSLSNVMFSVHMYWPLKWNGTKAQVETKVRNALDDAIAKNIPLIVGEFAEAFTDAGVVAASDSIPFRTIIAECNKREIGWLPWSWDGNNPQTDLDMTTNSTYAGLQTWGLEIMVTDSASVQKTAKAIAYVAAGLASGEFPSTSIPVSIKQPINPVNTSESINLRRYDLLGRIPQ